MGRIILKTVMIALFLVCATVVYLMYTKLSFIDWPYVLASFFFLTMGLLIKRKKKDRI